MYEVSKRENPQYRYFRSYSINSTFESAKRCGGLNPKSRFEKRQPPHTGQIQINQMQNSKIKYLRFEHLSDSGGLEFRYCSGKLKFAIKKLNFEFRI